jgi:hypothetical protein
MATAAGDSLSEMRTRGVMADDLGLAGGVEDAAKMTGKAVCLCHARKSGH